MNNLRLTLVAALSRDRVIGLDNQLPWKLPADLRRFKALTTGKTILMGRKTFESIGCPLPNRRNVVLSRSGFKTVGVETYGSLEAASQALPAGEEIMVIGGGEIYRQCLPHATRLALSVVQATVAGDAWFPVIQAQQWLLSTSEHVPADKSNAYGFTFMDFERSINDGATVPQFLSEA
jgi:dihydrofolate reductase